MCHRPSDQILPGDERGREVHIRGYALIVFLSGDENKSELLHIHGVHNRALRESPGVEYYGFLSRVIF